MCKTPTYPDGLRLLSGMLLLVCTVAGCRDYNLAPADLGEIEWVQTEGDVELGRLAITSGGVLVGVVEQNPRLIIRSRDGGASWEQVFTTPVGGEALTGHIATGPDRRVYAAVAGPADGEGRRSVGVYRSDDDGLNWQKSGESLTAGGINALAVNERGTVFLATVGQGPQGVYRSEDQGDSWVATQVTANPLSGGSILPRSLALGPDGLVLVALSTEQARSGLYRSSDGGENWTRLDLPPFVPSSLALARDRTAYGVGRPENRPELGDAVFFSPDEGSNWFPTPLTLEQSATSTITTTPREQVFVAAGFNGVFRSVDAGETWERVNEGLPLSPTGVLRTGVSQVLLAPDGYLYANASDAVYRSTGRVE